MVYIHHTLVEIYNAKKNKQNIGLNIYIKIYIDIYIYVFLVVDFDNEYLIIFYIN